MPNLGAPRVRTNYDAAHETYSEHNGRIGILACPTWSPRLNGQAKMPNLPIAVARKGLVSKPLLSRGRRMVDGAEAAGMRQCMVS
jgi:hypothetical protein